MRNKSIDGARLRAARGLVGWSGTDLASKAGVHLKTIAKIEQDDDEVNPTQKTIDKILLAFYREGVEFTDRGVQFIASVREFNGRDGFLAFKHDVYMTIKEGGRVFVSNVDERLFVKWAGEEAPAYREQMKSIENLDFRILIAQGDRNTTASEYAEYREDTSKYFRSDLPIFIYGTKTAHIVFHPDNVDVVIIDNETLTEANRERFLQRWEAALPLK